MESVYKARAGERLLIDVRGFRNLGAEVAWASEFFMGVRFAHPLHPAIYDEILADETSRYGEDVALLDDLAMRATHEASITYIEENVPELLDLAARCSRAAVINRLVQGLRAHEAQGRVAASSL